jgi:hypothetical protein
MSLATDPLPAVELRLMAMDWLIQRHPDAVIVTEFSVSNWGGALIDVAAITDTKIVGVEIKGTGDSATRLDRQGLAYGMVAKEMWLLPCPTLRDKCFAKRPPGWGRLEVWNGEVRPQNRAIKTGERVKMKYGWSYPSIRDDSRYEPDTPENLAHLSVHAMCGTLWKDELLEIAQRYKLDGVKKSDYVHLLTSAIEDQLPTTVVHNEMVAALRRRKWLKTVVDLRTDEGQSWVRRRNAA